jgi:hypothetical protein
VQEFVAQPAKRKLFLLDTWLRQAEEDAKQVERDFKSAPVPESRPFMPPWAEPARRLQNKLTPEERATLDSLGKLALLDRALYTAAAIRARPGAQDELSDQALRAFCDALRAQAKGPLVAALELGPKPYAELSVDEQGRLARTLVDLYRVKPTGAVRPAKALAQGRALPPPELDARVATLQRYRRNPSEIPASDAEAIKRLLLKWPSNPKPGKAGKP